MGVMTMEVFVVMRERVFVGSWELVCSATIMTTVVVVRYVMSKETA